MINKCKAIVARMFRKRNKTQPAWQPTTIDELLSANLQADQLVWGW